MHKNRRDVIRKETGLASGYVPFHNAPLDEREMAPLVSTLHALRMCYVVCDVFALCVGLCSSAPQQYLIGCLRRAIVRRWSAR